MDTANDAISDLLNAEPLNLSDTSTDTDSEMETEFEVESIEGKREIMGVTYYFIKWKNYPHEQNTWEPVEHLSCPEMIQEYEENHPEKLDSLKAEKVSKKRKTQKTKWSRKRAKKANDRGQMFDVAMKHNADIESIFDMKRFGGDIKYLVQYKGYKELEWMPATTIQRTDPLKVIEFYESCITWEN